MKIVALILALVAACAAEEGIRHSLVVPVQKLVDPVEGAPVPKPARIINGNAASRGQFPYQAALYMDGCCFCGGSLISNQWVLTAAHCVYDITTISVYLGAVRLNTVENDRVGITTRTKVVHLDYIAHLLRNDIALLDLGETVASTSSIQPIALASGSNDFAGTVARVSGWGKTADTGSRSYQLNYVDLTIITNSVCQETYGSLIVTASTICARGSDGHSTCNGDNGGPLVDSDSGQQIGIVSFVSSAGCTQGYDVGFVRVSSFRDWIAANSGV